MTNDRRRVAPWMAAFYANTVLVQAVTFVLRPTVIYRAIELDVPGQWLGLLGASFAIVPLALAVPSGQLVDRLGERLVMVSGAAATVLAAATLTVWSSHVCVLLVGCVLLGTGHLGSVVAQQALVANRTDPGRYDAAFGHYTFAASAGQAVGPALIVLFGGASTIPDTAAIFAWSTGVSLLLALSAVTLPRTPRRPSAPGQEDAGAMGTLLRRPGLLRALLVSCIVLAAVDISLVYLPLLGTERSIAASTIGVLLAVRAGSSMVSRFFLGRLTAAWGRRRLLLGSVALSTVSMALVPVPMPTWLLLVVVVALGLGLGCGQPLTMSWLAEATPEGMRGRAMSLRLTGNRLGQVVVPSAAGVVALGAGAGGVLWITAAALGVAGLAARGVHRPTRP
jgi:MFS family permease